MVLAGVAGYVAYRLFKVESERDRKADYFQKELAEEKSREQAASVGFWHDYEKRTIAVLNASKLPIYAVVITRGGETVAGISIVGWMRSFAALRPGESIELSISDHYDEDGDINTTGYRIWFDDNSNKRWVRSLDGDLRRFHPDAIRDFFAHGEGRV
ncbi:hypothetical protein GCM10009662_82670 [Catellatospora coxensis]|uniref:Uncharacterized protein n=2 Tax=Catellatospora coxensis TaxID=310354 RepID=A0A8J3LE82_9ACTN|nr:hypothetical protein Cco03nite_77700 [Catellatospora coxensis]